MNKNKLKYLITATIALTVVIVDLISKILAVSFLKEGSPINVFGEFLKLDLCFNKGIAFGQLALENTWILGCLSLVLSIGLGFLIYKYGDIKQKPVGTIAFALMLGGAFGNMIDRFFSFPACLCGEKGVVDFVNTNYIVELLSNGKFTWGIWNIADSMLCVGTFLLAIHIIFFEKENKNKKDNNKVVEEIIVENDTEITGDSND